jgi:hypothetical protein
MRPFILTVLISFSSLISFAQRAQTLMIGAQADLIKSDNDGFFKKIQLGMEANYYFSRKFSLTAGFEWWTDDLVSVVVGGRFSPIDEAFVRVRGLPGKDISIGAGFAKPLANNFRIEAMGDLYFNGHIAIRGGIAYGIGKSP